MPGSVFCQCLRSGYPAIDNQLKFGALLTYLSKAFDYLSHDLLIAKLNSYGFSIDLPRLVKNKSQTNNQNKFNIQLMRRNFSRSFPGVILGPLLFNVFICRLFFIMDDIGFASLADGGTP